MWFHRFARKEGIADAVLREAVARGRKRPDRRRPWRRGYQTAGGQTRAGKIEGLPHHHPIPTRSQGIRRVRLRQEPAGNIDDDEEEQFKKAAKHVLALTEKQLAELLKRGDFIEVKSE